MRKLIVVVILCCCIFTSCNVKNNEYQSKNNTKKNVSVNSNESDITDAIIDMSKYTVALIGVTDGDLHKENATHIDVNLKEYKNADIDKYKVLKNDCSDIELVYQNTVERYGEKTHKYSNDEAGIKCSFFDETDNIAQIVINSMDVEIKNNKLTEDLLVSWAKELFFSYGIYGYESFHYSCETNVIKMSEYSVSQDSFEYFYLPTDSKTVVSSYTVFFTRHINGMRTSDIVSVYWNLTTNTVIIKNHNNTFENKTDLILNKKDINSAIEEYINSSVNVQKYDVKSFFVSSEKLTVIDNRLCVLCDVELDIKTKVDDSVEFSNMFEYAVFLE